MTKLKAFYLAIISGNHLKKLAHDRVCVEAKVVPRHASNRVLR